MGSMGSWIWQRMALSAIRQPRVITGRLTASPTGFSTAWTTPAATVTINFTNTLPAGLADEYSTTVNLTLSVNASTGLLHNDGDVDGDSITVELVTQPAPAEGSLDELNSDGSFTFIPTDWFTGDATFTYHLFDGLEYSDPITATIHVGGIRIFLPNIRRPAVYKVYLPVNVRVVTDSAKEGNTPPGA